MTETTTTAIDSASAEPTYRGFLTPHHPRTDEICAIAVYEYREMQRLGLTRLPVSEIVFWDRPECSMDDLGKFLKNRYLILEIGVMGYESVGATSATEAMLATTGLDPASLTTGERKLLEILARRNGKGPQGKKEGGYMNQFYMSLPKALKDIYLFPDYGELDVLNRYKDIVHAYLEYENRQPGEPAVVIPGELADLANLTQKCQLNAFTPGRYLRDLCYRGEAPEQIREKVSFWIEAVNRFQSELSSAETEWHSAEKLEFAYPGGKAVAIETVNRFISKVAFRASNGRYQMIIIRNSGEGIAVLTQKKNVSNLRDELERREPGRWHFHNSAGSLLSGSPMFPGLEPTNLTTEELVRLVQEFPPQ